MKVNTVVQVPDGNGYWNMILLWSLARWLCVLKACWLGWSRDSGWLCGVLVIDDRSALDQGLTGPSAHLAALPMVAPKWVPNRRGRTCHDSPTLSRFCPQEGGTVEAVRIAFPSLLGGLSLFVVTTCYL